MNFYHPTSRTPLYLSSLFIAYPDIEAATRTYRPNGVFQQTRDAEIDLCVTVEKKVASLRQARYIGNAPATDSKGQSIRKQSHNVVTLLSRLAA
jgi:hypothetical protein